MVTFGSLPRPLHEVLSKPSVGSEIALVSSLEFAHNQVFYGASSYPVSKPVTNLFAVKMPQ